MTTTKTYQKKVQGGRSWWCGNGKGGGHLGDPSYGSHNNYIFPCHGVHSRVQCFDDSFGGN